MLSFTRVAVHPHRRANLVACSPRRHAEGLTCRRLIPTAAVAKLPCPRCGQLFDRDENRPDACAFHGDIVGLTTAYNLYEDHHYDDPALDGKPGPRFGRRWGCCQETDADAPPCKRGWHITFADGKERISDVRLASRG